MKTRFTIGLVAPAALQGCSSIPVDQTSAIDGKVVDTGEYDVVI